MRIAYRADCKVFTGRHQMKGVKNMKHYMRKMGWLVFGIAFLLIPGMVFARSSATVVIQDKEVVPGDKYVRAQFQK